jgi:hypothetical protein
MKHFLAFIIILLSLPSFGQNQLKKVDCNPNFTYRNQSLDSINEYYFGLDPIKKSIFMHHFRLLRAGQIIDIFSNDGLNFSGQLINKILEGKQVKTDYGKDEEFDKYVYEILQLDKIKSSELGQLILKQQIYSLPTDTLIKNWNKNWLDCGSIDFESKTNDIFQFSNYSCPWEQLDATDYIFQIRSLYKSFISILDLDHEYSVFESKLEKGKSYSSEGSTVMYIMTDKESDAWRKDKPRRDYLKSIKDTIDNYVNAELSKQKIKLNNIDCFETYKLIFSKNGYLKKVRVLEYDKPKLKDGLDSYIKDNREIRKCRQKIKEIFESINLNFLNLKYGFTRKISFGNNQEIEYSDDTNY